MFKVTPYLKNPDLIHQEPVDVQKRIFDRLMVIGWKEQKKGYVSGIREEVGDSYCALGIVGERLGVTNDVERYFPLLAARNYHLAWQIAKASNAAGNKTAAIKAVKEISWMS